MQMDLIEHIISTYKFFLDSHKFPAFYKEMAL
jgi:hypothetical protein